MPKKHVLIVHGGSCWQTRAEYVADLKQEEFRLNFSPRVGWHKNLQKDLGPGFKVLGLDMPNWQCAKYEEWKIWFEKALAFAGGAPVVIGHSLGGLFSIKYFSETVGHPNVKGILLVGTPYKTVTEDRNFGDFALRRKPERLNTQNVRFYHSQDDPIVDFADFLKYKKVLPAAGFRKFTGHGHFIGSHFPEIARDMRALFNSR